MIFLFNSLSFLISFGICGHSGQSSNELLTNKPKAKPKPKVDITTDQNQTSYFFCIVFIIKINELIEQLAHVVYYG